MSSPDFISIRQAADRLGVTYATMWRMVQEGQVQAVRVRSLVRIPIEALSDLPLVAPVQKGAPSAEAEV